MSKIGKKPIIIPEDVQVKINERNVLVTGPKGELSYELTPLVDVKIEDNNLTVNPLGTSRSYRAMHGLTRTLINNMVVGVSTGFNKDLEMKGVGYKAAIQENDLVLSLGFSHPINFPIPSGIEITVKKNTISIAGIDKQLVGETAAQIRRLRPPEPYKGKGIKYADEVIRRKAGKTAKASA